MKVVVAGGSGFLGRPLAARLALSGHEVVVLTRSTALGRTRSGLRYASWTPDGTIPNDPVDGAPAGRSRGDDWAAEIDGADAVINLAGSSIADVRWTPARKQELRDSRIQSTRSLIAAIRAARDKPSIF